MYKVFVNDKPIIFTDSLFGKTNFELLHYKNIVIPEILHRLINGTTQGVTLYCMDLEKCWKDFQNHFRVMTAGGGLVTNTKNEILFIYRANKWDLPKGRAEKNESIETTAIREVQEECGISELELKKFLLTTYHIFTQDQQEILKVTHWYLMHSPLEEKLSPQLEEGITIAEFKNKKEVKKALENTYANIRLVLEAYNE